MGTRFILSIDVGQKNMAVSCASVSDEEWCIVNTEIIDISIPNHCQKQMAQKILVAFQRLMGQYLVHQLEVVLIEKQIPIVYGAGALNCSINSKIECVLHALFLSWGIETIQVNPVRNPKLKSYRERKKYSISSIQAIVTSQAKII